MKMLSEAACKTLGVEMRAHSKLCVSRGVDGRVSGTYLPEPVRPWRRRQQQSWYAAGPLLDRNATVGRGL